MAPPFATPRAIPIAKPGRPDPAAPPDRPAVCLRYPLELRPVAPLRLSRVSPRGPRRRSARAASPRQRVPAPPVRRALRPPFVLRSTWHHWRVANRCPRRSSLWAWPPAAHASS